MTTNQIPPDALWHVRNIHTDAMCCVHTPLADILRKYPEDYDIKLMEAILDE